MNGTTLYTFAAAADASGPLARGGPVVALVRHAAPAARKPFAAEVIAIGPAGEVGAGAAAIGARRVDLPGHVLIPALVNAHTHLDLTHVGPRPHPAADRPGTGFTEWVRIVLQARATTDEQIAASVSEGVERSVSGGVVAVGDVGGVGRTAPLEALRASPLEGVSFIEFFGLGDRQAVAVSAMEALAAATSLDSGGVRLGLSPHAPYSAGLRVYEAAAELSARLGLPLQTHLGESLDERQFVMRGFGPFRRLFEELGLLNGSSLQDLARGRRPIEHLAGALAAASWSLAHGNDSTDEEIALLARAGASVVYCPRCHEYFGHEATLGPHAYRRMLDAGVNVALGTDSIINLPLNPDGSWPSLSTLDEARLLARRDGFDPTAALGMCTTRGARSLGLDESRFRLTSGSLAGLAAVEVGRAHGGPAAAIMASDSPAVLLCADSGAGGGGI